MTRARDTTCFLDPFCTPHYSIAPPPETCVAPEVNGIPSCFFARTMAKKDDAMMKKDAMCDDMMKKNAMMKKPDAMAADPMKK